ncbi:MAG: SulP family inorganic anion transporter [Elusimicrobiota bacterium]|jgi:SulP family sulfate permease
MSKVRKDVLIDWSAEALGGFAAMLVAMPQAIAFGVVIYGSLGPDAAASGALAGIIGTAALGIIAPLLGGTARLISAPCAPAAAVLAALGGVLAVGPAHGDPVRLALLLTLTILLSGALQLLYGLIGGGRLIKYIPYPVVAGYLSGVAVLIFLGQVPRLLGCPGGTSLWSAVSSPALWRWPAILVGVGAISGMVLGSRVLKRIPSPILGLLGGGLAYALLSLHLPELRVLSGNKLIVGPLCDSAFSFSSAFTRWSAAARLTLMDLHGLLAPALTLSVLLSMDTLKTCVVLDALTRSRHDSNRELMGQGFANMASAFMGGVPGAGTMGASLVNTQSGGRTRVSGALEGVFALFAFLAVGNWIAWVPIAALAGMLLVVGWRMFDRKSFRLLRKPSTFFDFAVMASVVASAVLSDLMTAAGVGLALSILLFIREQIRGSVVRRKGYGDRIFSKQRRLPEEMELLERLGGRTAVCELQGSLFFGTADQLLCELDADLKICRFVILDLRRVQSLDFTAAHLFQQIEERLRERGGHLLLSSLPASLPSGQDLKAYFDEIGLVTPKRGAKIFDGLDDALAWSEDRVLEDAHGGRRGAERALSILEIDLFRELEPDLCAALEGCLQERSFRVGETVFRQGDSGDEIFVVRRGRVRVELPLRGGRTHHLATFGQGDFFGDMAFVDRGVRSADAVAAAPSDLYVLSRERFNEAVRKHPVLGIRLFARLARALTLRLRLTDGELRVLQES